MDLEHERRLADVESRCKTNTHRIDKLEELTNAVNRLATSTEVFANKLFRNSHIHRTLRCAPRCVTLKLSTNGRHKYK